MATTKIIKKIEASKGFNLNGKPITPSDVIKNVATELIKILERCTPDIFKAIQKDIEVQSNGELALIAYTQDTMWYFQIDSRGYITLSKTYLYMEDFCICKIVKTLEEFEIQLLNLNA